MPITEPPQDTVAPLLPYQRHLLAWGMTLRSCLDFYYIVLRVSVIACAEDALHGAAAGDSGPAAAVPAPVPGLGRGPGAVKRARGHPSRRNGHGKTLQVIAILQQVLLYPNGSQIDGSEAVPCVWDFLADGLGCSKTLQVKLSA